MMSSGFHYPHTSLPSPTSSEPKPHRQKPLFSLPSDNQIQAPDSVSDPPDLPKAKASPQLKRWSRARAIRSGRRLLLESRSASRVADAPPKDMWPVLSTNSSEDDDDDSGLCLADSKSIYMVSDGTGWTAEHSVNAALGQFEHCLADRGCATSTHLFSGGKSVRPSITPPLIILINSDSDDFHDWQQIDEDERLMEIIKQAAQDGALLLYTLADPAMAESAKEACKVWGVPAADILGPITEAIAAHLGVSPSGIPRGAPGRRPPLTKEYFRRIEAIEFTIKQDDGAQPQNLINADIVLVGVSRTGKTPLSIYLAQKGYKVANVPIVMGVDLPRTLFEVQQEKIFGLVINPVVLQTIRRARAKSLGFSSDMRGNYSDMDHVREELDFARKIFARNPVWPVIEVTGKAVEETAAVVVRIHHDRKQRCSMPRISKRY